MTFWKLVWIFVQVVIGYNLLLPVVLYLMYAIKKGRRTPVVKARNQEADYAVIVTAYQQTQLLPAVVDSLLAMNYQNYLIYIVADNCDVSHLKFDSNKVVLLRPEETLSSNTRSHFYAIQRFRRPHERLTIIDSDNLVDPEYLNEISRYFDKGFTSVQGVRQAKNLDTAYACLDAARDIYYHFYDGKLLFGCGSSATLAGSGMAFTTELYRRCLEHLDVTGAGFDKVLQYQIVSSKERIAFAADAVVYDEKTSKSTQLVQQRARWINTWFRYFTYGFRLIGSGITQRNWNQFLFGVVLVRPPLFLFILLSGACFLLNLFYAPLVAALWAGAMMVFALGFVIALTHGNTPRRIYSSLLQIPKFMFFQVVSLASVSKANKKSVATTHYHNVVLEKVQEEVLVPKS